jgi:hypothetical protein
MRRCENCGKKTYEGKHREVALPTRRVVLCPECGTLRFQLAGQAMEGRVQAVTMPARKTKQGRNVTFHVEQPLRIGDRIEGAVFDPLPGNPTGLPGTMEVLHVKPLVVREKVDPPAGDGAAKGPRLRNRTVGYAVNAIGR